MKSSVSQIRLQKALADAGLGARRDCEELIAAGRVRVNGQLVTTLPYFVDPERDVVAVDAEIIELASAPKRAAATPLVYVLLNKPKGVVTTTGDPQRRRNVLDLVPRSLQKGARLFPIGRLDVDSTGLLLLTNDGDLAYRLTHPRFAVAKHYRAVVRGLATSEQLEQLKRGIYLITPTAEGTDRKRSTVESVRIIKRLVDRHQGDRTLLSITLREGHNREIRRMLARVGLKVRSLECAAIGPLSAQRLRPGECKLLSKKDVDRLRAATLADERSSRIRASTGSE